MTERRAKLNVYGPPSLQLIAVSMLVFASQISDSLFVRSVDLGFAFAIVALGAFLFGRRSAYASMKRAMSWVPKNIHVSENDEGVKIAFVERESGDIVTLELPDEIDSTEAAMLFILDELTPDE